VYFGSHTRSHVPLDELPPAEAKAEVEGGQADLEDRQLPRAWRATALPRGRLGPISEAQLADRFEAVMTTEPGVNPPGATGLFVKRRDGRMLTLAGRHHPAKLRLELTGLLDPVRRLLQGDQVDY
jgi:peptidoglycan/xylan/chitin deacetylase (PgdA/CDA1 family)